MLACVAGHTRIRLGNGGIVSVSYPPLLRAIFGGECRLDYTLPTGDGTTVLWRDFVNIPILVMADETNNTLFCIYNYDTDLRLLCLQPNQKFNSSETNKWSCLNSVVCSSTWKAREARLSEWQRAFDILERMSARDFKRQRIPIYDLHIICFGFSFGDVHKNMMSQIHAMLKAGSDQWPIIANQASVSSHY